MKEILCKKCGASEWYEQNGIRICNYCGTNYQLTENERKHYSSNISVNSDIALLLQKCQAEPNNARKYANLILDIDPSNLEALKYL